MPTSEELSDTSSLLLQAKANFRRVRAFGSALKGIVRGLDHLKSWEEPRHSLMAYAFIIALALFPSKTLAGLLVYFLYRE